MKVAKEWARDKTAILFCHLLLFLNLARVKILFWDRDES